MCFKLIGAVKLHAAIFALKKFEIQMPSLMIFKISIGDEFLATEGAGENFLTGVGSYMLKKTAQMFIFFTTSLERTFLDFVLVHFY
jgi:hypothetical protein